MQKWIEFFDQYGEDLLKAMSVKEITMWYGAPFTYWLTHSHRYGKVGA